MESQSQTEQDQTVEQVDTATELEQLRAEVKKLRKEREIVFKIGPKGGVSVYGLGSSRFPMTLYADQWSVLFKHIPDLQQFIEENKDKLASKEPK